MCDTFGILFSTCFWKHAQDHLASRAKGELQSQFTSQVHIESEIGFPPHEVFGLFGPGAVEGGAQFLDSVVANEVVDPGGSGERDENVLFRGDANLQEGEENNPVHDGRVYRLWSRSVQR